MTKKFTAALLLLLLATTALGLQTPESWVKFKPPTGRFSVLLPGVPKEEKETKNDGGPLSPFTNYLYTTQTENAFYIVGYVDLQTGRAAERAGRTRRQPR